MIIHAMLIHNPIKLVHAPTSLDIPHTSTPHLYILDCSCQFISPLTSFEHYHFILLPHPWFHPFHLISLLPLNYQVCSAFRSDEDATIFSRGAHVVGDPGGRSGVAAV